MKLYDGHIRRALITARYEHRVIRKSNDLTQYLYREGLIEDDPNEYGYSNKAYTRVRITDKGKQKLRELRIKAGQFERLSVSTPDVEENLEAIARLQKRLGIKPNG